MLQLIKELFKVFTIKQKKDFFSLVLLVLMMSLFEILTISGIGIFVAVLSNPKWIETYQLLQVTVRYLENILNMNVSIITGMIVLVILLIGSLLSILTIWKLSLFSSRIGTEFADRLYKVYLNQPWLYHSQENSAYLIKKISFETIRFTDQLLTPLLIGSSRLILAVFIIMALVFYNPIIILTGTFAISLLYMTLYRIVRFQLKKNGKIVSDTQSLRYKLLSEGFGGIKDILLLGRQNNFLDRFQAEGKNFAFARGVNSAFLQSPRYIIEFIAFGSMIVLILVLSIKQNNNLNSIAPTLALYCTAGFKLLPAFQIIYNSIAQIRGNQSSFDMIKHDLFLEPKDIKNTPFSHTENLDIKLGITLENISFRYPGKSENALTNVNLKLPLNQTIGLVGKSGSGKSTMIDILLGLIEPDAGAILIDNKKLSQHNLRLWQNKIGFVPQTIFLSDASIAENIAFGIPSHEINDRTINDVINLVCLNEFIQYLPEGAQTRIGERGVQISGGQRQRIGIARALYHNPDVLIFDEATSALDGITEKYLMDAINNLAGKKTIVLIAHRLATVKKCDIIYFLSNGRINDQGTYSELIHRNEEFKTMADVS